MANWIIYAVIIVVGSAIFNVLLKSSTDKITPLLGAVLLQLAAFVVILLFWIKERLNGADEIILTTQGVIYSVSAGIIIALVNWSIFVMYENSAPPRSSNGTDQDGRHSANCSCWNAFLPGRLIGGQVVWNYI